MKEEEGKEDKDDDIELFEEDEKEEGPAPEKEKADRFRKLKIPTKKSRYESWKPYFDIVAHNYKRASRTELNITNQLSNSTFEKRVSGFNELIRYRNEHPGESIVIVSNHLSEADFIETMIYFLNNKERLLVQGGDNLFIDDLSLANHYMGMNFNLDKFLKSKGAFQIIRNPKEVELNGEIKKLNTKDVLNINKSYLYNLVFESEMFLQYPGQSIVGKTLKQGRAYNGKIHSFSRAMFQLLIEASLFTESEIHIAPMNISYESVLEDTIFKELLWMKADGKSDREIYMHDIGHVMSEYINPERKGKMCIKFGSPKPMGMEKFWRKYSLRKKAYSIKLANEYYNSVMSMQTPFPSNIFFAALEGHKKLDERHLEEKILLITEIMNLRKADMHYLTHEGEYKQPSKIIDESLEIFEPRGVVAREKGEIISMMPYVTSQYANHISFFLKNNE